MVEIEEYKLCVYKDKPAKAYRKYKTKEGFEEITLFKLMKILENVQIPPLILYDEEKSDD